MTGIKWQIPFPSHGNVFSKANNKIRTRACRVCLMGHKRKTPDISAKSVVFLFIVYLVLENIQKIYCINVLVFTGFLCNP